MKYLLSTAILIGLAAYVAAFYMVPLPGLPTNDAGQPPWRIEMLTVFALRPDEWLLSNWFGAPWQFMFADRLPVLLVAGLILAWAAVLGWLLVVLLRRLCGGSGLPAPIKAGGTPAPQRGQTPASQLTPLETFVFSLAVGLSAASTWVLSLGLFGVLERTWLFEAPAIVTFLATAGVCYCRMKRWANGRRLAAAGLAPNSRLGAGAAVQLPPQQLHREALPPGYSNNFLRARWLWLALPFGLAILLAAMLPPTDFDVREYHLQAPKEFFQQGKITFLPHNVYANMPLGTEMLSLLAMVIAGDWWWGALAGKTVIAAFTPLCALGLYAAGRRFYSAGAGVAAALLYISIPWVVSTSVIPATVNVSASGLVEGALACYLFLAVYALLLAGGQAGTTVRFTHPTGFLILAGYLAGAAVATKYPAVLFVLLPLAAWVFLRRLLASGRSQGSGGRGQDWKAASIRDINSEPSPLAPGPRTPNPFLSAVTALTVFLLAAAAGCGLWFGKNWVQTGNPTYPLLYGVFDGKTWNADKDRQFSRVHQPDDFSAETFGKDLGRVVLTSEWLSPLLVPLAALAFLCRPRRLAWGLLFYVAFVVVLWWLFTHRIDRFWIPVLPLVALLAGAGACWTSAAWWRIFFKGLLLAGLAANFLVAAAGPGNAWFVPLDQLRNDSPRWIDPWHRYFNDEDLGGGILAVGDAEVFDLKPPVFYNTCFDDCIFEQLVKGRKPWEVQAELASRHIAYVFVNWGEISRYRNTYGFTDFVRPEVFEELVKQGVLAPLPTRPGYAEEAYRVLTARARHSASSL